MISVPLKVETYDDYFRDVRKREKNQQGRNENSGIKDDKWEDLKKCKQIDL